MLRPEMFGAVGDGETDNAVAFFGISTFSETFGGEIYFPYGTFFSSAPLVIGKNASLSGAGKGSTVFYSVDVGDAERQAVIRKTGEEPQPLPRLASDVMERDVVLHFETAHGLRVGDSVLISNPTDYSFSGYREYYREGSLPLFLR